MCGVEGILPMMIWLGPILVVPIIRTIIYLGLFWGPLFMEAPIYILHDLIDQSLEKNGSLLRTTGSIEYIQGHMG